MPGTRASMPYVARPVTIAALSTPATRVPISRKWEGSLRTTSSGTGMRAASAASAPYDSRRPVGGCTTTPASTRQAEGATPHRVAAAAMSRWRAVAPAFRSPFQFSLTAVLPPAPWSP